MADNRIFQALAALDPKYLDAAIYNLLAACTLLVKWLVGRMYKRWKEMERVMQGFADAGDRSHNAHKRTREMVNRLWRKIRPEDDPPLSDLGPSPYHTDRFVN